MIAVIVLSGLSTDVEVQEVWLSAVIPLNAKLIVPMESLRRHIRSHFGSLVEIRYPDLVNNGKSFFFILWVTGCYERLDV